MTGDLTQKLALGHPKLALGISEGTDDYQSMKKVDNMTKVDTMVASF